jgi:hypothetical protein
MFQIGISPRIYNSQSFWNLNSFPKGILFLFNLSTTMPRLEIFGVIEVPLAYCASLNHLNI